MAGEVRMPVWQPDFAPFMQAIKDEKPDVLFIFVPGRQAGDRAHEGLSATSAWRRPASS